MISRLKRIFHKPSMSKDMKIIPYAELQKLMKCFNGDNEFPLVLYFGDLVVERISRDDLNQSTLGEMVTEDLKDIPTCYISHSSYNPKIYYYLLSALEKMKGYPKVVILPVNLRCFSPQWDLNPQWQFEDEIRLYKGLLKASRKRNRRVVRNRNASIQMEKVSFNSCYLPRDIT